MDPRSVPVRISNLKRFGKSPLHYVDGLTDDVDSRVIRVGYAVHARVLGSNRVVVYDGERRGNAWKTFAAEHDGQVIVTTAEDDDAAPIAAAVKAHPLARKILTGQRELEIDWTWLGRACQSHLDVLADRHIADLKITGVGPPEKFRWHALKMGWHAQGAFYRRAAQAKRKDQPVDDVYVVAVENKRPHAVTVRRFTPAALEAGDRLCRLWMEQLLQCEASGSWPAYCDDVLDLDVPADEETRLIVDGEEIAA